MLDVAGKGAHVADMAGDDELVLYVGLRGALQLVWVAAGALVVWGGGGRPTLAATSSDIILLTPNHAEALGAAPKRRVRACVFERGSVFCLCRFYVERGGGCRAVGAGRP